MQKAIELQRANTEKELIEIVKEVSLQLEKQSSCFELFASVRINEGEGLQLVKLDNRTDLGVDTVETFYWSRENMDTLDSYKQLHFSTPADLEVELRFEYLYPPGTEAPQSFKQKNRQSVDGLHTIHDFREKFSSKASFFDYVDISTAKQLFAEKLHSSGLNSDYEFKFSILENGKERILFSSSDDIDPNAQGFSSTLFLNSYFIHPVQLSLFYPDINLLISKFPWFTVFSTIGISLLILIISWLLIQVVNKQGKLATWRKDFIDNMVHEFKTPITNISLATETIAKYQEGLNDRQKALITIIRQENHRQQENIDAVLKGLSYEKLSPALQLEEIDMNEVLKKVVKPHKVKVEEKKGEFVLIIRKDAPPVFTDEFHLTNVLDNLLDNAVKYSASNLKIEVSTKSDDSFNSITIEDKGIGMNKEQLIHAFEKFYRGNDGNLHNVKGFGLGLSYVKWALNQLNGEIEISSKIGFGTKVKILIPNILRKS